MSTKPKGAWGRAAASVGALAAGLTLSAGATLAQDTSKPEEVKKMYDDALVQLRAAQERKNQLAAENEKLAAQVKELQQQIVQVQEQMEELKRTDADHAEKTFFLRAHYAAWQGFIRSWPEASARWRVYLGEPLLSTPHMLPDGIRLDAPLEDVGKEPRPDAPEFRPSDEKGATTAPTTATVPTTTTAPTPSPATVPAPTTQPATTAPATNPS